MEMAEVYANLIIKEKKTISEVPEKLIGDVKAVLSEKGFPELAVGDN